MKLSIDCLPCLLSQAATLAKWHLSEEDDQFALMNRVLKELLVVDRKSAPCAAQRIHRVLKEILGNPDPYREQKIYYNLEMLKLEEEFSKILAQAQDPLEQGLKLAAAGNIIDFGPQQELSSEKVLAIVQETLRKNLNPEVFEALKEKLAQSRLLLYLGDNAGEIVLDKLFIKEIKRTYKDLEIYFAVRGQPVLNDITREDAYLVDMDRYARIIDNGDDAPGTVLERCSPEFLDIFQKADLIIAKGQGNFESLYEECEKDVFFIFLCKCNVFEEKLGVRRHDMVLMPSWHKRDPEHNPHVISSSWRD